MRQSRYHDDYLLDSDQRIKRGSRPLSVGAFLAARLRGRARVYTSRYKEALIKSLRRAGCVECESQLGGLAFKRK